MACHHEWVGSPLKSIPLERWRECRKCGVVEKAVELDRFCRKLDPPLSWTTEQPTQPGWYWFKGWRIDDQRDERHDIELDVVRVFGPASCDGYHGEWAGPLEMPI